MTWTDSSTELFDGLVALVPEFRPILADHLAWTDGELLTVLLGAEFGEFIVYALTGRATAELHGLVPGIRARDPDLLRRISTVLERWAEDENPSVHADVLGTGVLETDLVRYGTELLRIAGPALVARMRTYVPWVFGGWHGAPRGPA